MSSEIQQSLVRDGYAVLPRLFADDDWQEFAASWEALPVDRHLNAIGYRRRRRFSKLEAMLTHDGSVAQAPVQSQLFLQDTDRNAFSGISRILEPCGTATLHSALFRGLLRLALATVSEPGRTWLVNVHQMRITCDIGHEALATPEGLHNDGHRYILMVLVGRHGFVGGTSHLLEAADEHQEPARIEFQQPGEAILLDDTRMLHEVTPLRAVKTHAYRDMLLIDLHKEITG